MSEQGARSPFSEAATHGAGGDGEGSGGPRRIAKVYLRHPANSSGEVRRLGLVARRLGLELYSSALLTRKNRTELTVLAVMLVGVFCFELLAWSFFLNGIFVGGMLDLHPVGSTAAVVLGFLFAATIFYFERQVLTADVTRLPRWKKVAAGGARILAIAIGGYVVAHSIDLVAFRVPVQQELHRETIRVKASLLERELEELRREDGRRKESKEEIKSLRDSLANLRLRRDNEQAIAEELRRANDSREQVEQRALNDLLRIEARVAMGEAPGGQLESARYRADQAADAARSGRGQYSRALTTLQRLDNQIAALQQEERDRSDELRDLIHEDVTKDRMVGRLETRARRWLSAVAEERPSSAVDYAAYEEDLSAYPISEVEGWPTEWREPFRLDPPNAHFFEKLAKIYTLALDVPEAGSFLLAEAPADPMRRLLYRSVLIGIHAAVMLIPFLVLGVKWLLLPKEVDAYFSTWHQAFAGDPEARLILSVEEKVRREKEPW